MAKKKGQVDTLFDKKKKDKIRPEVVKYLNELAELGLNETEIADELSLLIRKKGRRQVHGISGWLDDTYAHPLWEERYRNNPRDGKDDKQSGHSIWLYVLLCVLMVHLPAIHGLASALEWQKFSTISNVEGTHGILLLGIDNVAGYAVEGGNADSITYVSANWNTKKAVMLPIYRDAKMMQACTGTSDNVNRIYKDQGITCLVESVSRFLELPIDYYALVTFHGLINILNSLGGVSMTPSSSYCSAYGEDGKTHCFIAGQTQIMDGPQALAYLRYRGLHTGEARANRQLELLYAIKDHCAQNVLSCYLNIPPEFAQGVRTNMSLAEVKRLPDLFSDAFEMKSLEVLAGRNEYTENGWTQNVSAYDLITKNKIIRDEIFGP